MEHKNNMKVKIFDTVMMKVVKDNHLTEIKWDLDAEYSRKDEGKPGRILTPAEGINNALSQHWIDNKIPWQHCRYDLIKIAIDNTSKVDGLYLDFGTLTGNCIKIMSELLPNKTIYGFDSWQGYPDDFGVHKKGAWAIPVPNSKADGPGRGTVQYKVNDNVELVVGYFEDTLQKFLVEHPQPINLIQIDCDLYNSTKCVLFTCAPQMYPGTYVEINGFYNRNVIDGSVYWFQDEMNAWYDFVEEFNVEFEWVGSQGFCILAVIKSIKIK